MSFAKKTENAKAISAIMAREAKSNQHIRWEHNAAFYSAGDDTRRPGRHNISAAEFEAMFSRRRWAADASGANKVVYLNHPDGTPLKYICIKRDRIDGNESLIEECGIQCVLEIKAYEKLADTPDIDCLCPIFKYFLPRSDRAGVEKTRQRVIIICQKADYISSLADCCREADERNWTGGYKTTENAQTRRARLEDLCRRMGWHDIIGRGWGGGGRNCGVIFDYAANCWKAVIVDYAL